MNARFDSLLGLGKSRFNGALQVHLEASRTVGFKPFD